MARISIDNGNTFFGPDELDDFFWTVNVRIAEHPHSYGNTYGSIWCNIVNMMDDEIREKAHAEIDPEHDDQSFLRRYLELSPEDLIIG